MDAISGAGSLFLPMNLFNNILYQISKLSVTNRLSYLTWLITLSSTITRGTDTIPILWITYSMNTGTGTATITAIFTC